jgi:hypothetical protein
MSAVAPADDRLNPKRAKTFGVRTRIAKGSAGMGDFFELRLDFFVSGLARRGPRRLVNRSRPVQHFAVVTHVAEFLRQAFRG